MLAAGRPARPSRGFNSWARGGRAQPEQESQTVSKQMLRINLAELETVRVLCMKCKKGVIEVPVSRLGSVFDRGECRFCNHQHLPSSEPEPLNNLEIALQELKAKAPDLEIEFEIPAP
jgi:hypothetical protein